MLKRFLLRLLDAIILGGLLLIVGNGYRYMFTEVVTLLDFTIFVVMFVGIVLLLIKFLYRSLRLFK